MKTSRFVGFLALALLLAAPAFAETASATQDQSQTVKTPVNPADIVVRAIRVEGTNRIEKETVRSYLVLKMGDKFTPERMDQSLKSLYATGLFADVTLRREGSTLVVRVVENPIINRLAFEGNNKISNSALRKEVKLRPRVVYTRTRVQADTKRILEIYRASGRFAATVEPKVITLPQNRVNLVFEIHEGDKTGIRRISFIGNRAFSDRELRGVIRTRESIWWRFFGNSDTYDPDRLTFDQELLRKFYLSKGYADFRNVNVVAELTPDREDFFITFTLDEGKRYKFGKIAVATTLKSVNVARLRAVVVTKRGARYNGNLVEKSIEKLTDAMGIQGYAFVVVRPRIKRNRKALTVGVTYDIREGPKVFVERIEIIGNTRTRDEVIRREMRLSEGDAFNTAKIRESRRRIRALNFFDKVEITNIPGSAPDRTIVRVLVKEKSTGQFSLGAGFSSADGAVGTVGLRERNFMGRGQNVGINFSISQRSQTIDLSFTEPYLFGRKLLGGFDIFRTTRNFTSEGGFDQRTTGFKLRTGYEIAEHLTQGWTYNLSQSTVDNVKSNASRFVVASTGGTSTSSLATTLRLDRRDDPRNPSEGYVVSLSTQVAGLGGTERFIKPQVKAIEYYSIYPDWITSVSMHVGTIRGLGRKVRLTDRFFVGQDQIRGFAVGGIGPRDSATGDALGADTFYAGSVELSFPLGLPKEFGIKAHVFADVASAFGLDETGPSILDVSTPRISAGFGVSWDSPFGPVRVDLGFPVVKKSFDKTQLFRFNFGTRF